MILMMKFSGNLKRIERSILAALVVLNFAPTARAQNVSVSALPTQVPMRALPDVNFDEWIRILATPKPSMKPFDAQWLTSEITRLALESHTHLDLYTILKAVPSRIGLGTLRSHLALADALLDARRAVRLATDIHIQQRYARMTLLQFLAEEVLFTVARKYPGRITEYSRTYSEIPDSVRAAEPTADLLGIKVMAGDIVASKSSGQGSSAFIALANERPGLFSHATSVYVDPKSGELLSPEAYIEDGVKLRPMQKSYIEKRKTRMSVYRAARTESETDADFVSRLRAASNGVSALVAEMYQRTSDPRENAAFSYNFSMNPQVDGAYTCAETVMDAYTLGGLKGNFNPYPQNLWGTFDKGHREIFSEFLEVHEARLPSPNDIDMNTKFDLAGVTIDVTKLSQERAEMAALDAVFTLIANDHRKIRASLKVFDNLGEKPVTREQLAYIRSLEVIPPEIRAKLSVDIPPDINVKQLIFFGYLNQVFTPKVREAILADATKFGAANARPPGLNELRGMAVQHVIEHIEKLRSFAAEYRRRSGLETELAKITRAKSEAAARSCEAAFAAP